MKILSGQQAENQNEAVRLALQTAGVDGIDTYILDMFEALSDSDKINAEADKIIGSTIRNRYGSKASWRTERWFVPVPKLHYEGKDIPQLIIEVDIYLIATAVVKTQDSRLTTLAGTVGKPETLAIPMVFLHALLEEDLGRFAVAARDASYTTWDIPGMKPVRLPNDFVSELTEMLKYQSVVSWLDQFGSQGRYVAPLVAGSLLGLAFRDSTQSLPANKEIMTTDDLISALESMAYQPAEAKEMVRSAASRLRADTTLEEAIRITLQMGKGGDIQ
ncbi:RuvA C-terminal domain-containing protein [Chloroflexota bacterium]